MKNIVNAPFKGKITSININGKKTDWREEEISYEELMFAAYPNLLQHPKGESAQYNMSAAYDYPQNIDKRGKIFHMGESVKVEDGMIFNIHDTSNA